MQVPRPTDYPTLDMWALELVRRLERENFAAELARRLVGGSGIGLQYDPQKQTITLSSGLAPGALDEVIDDRVAALLIAGSGVTLTYDDVGNTLTIASAAGLSGTVVVTVPHNSYRVEQTVAATGVTPASRITLSLAPMAPTDENSVDLLRIAAIGAVPGVDQITVQMAFLVPTSGPIPLNWSAV